jgi:polysaccharide biosynthesis protein PslH
MRILFLTQIIPWPIDAGPKMKTWNVLRFLHSQGHDILLASFVRAEEEPYVEVMKQVCESVYPIPIRRSRLANGFYYLRSLITQRPFLVERDDLSGMRNLVCELLKKEEIDVIHADQLTMVQFAFQTPYPPSLNGNERIERNASQPAKDKSAVDHRKPILVFDAHNAVWAIIERMRNKAPWFLKPLLSLEAHRIKKYEGAVVRYFDHTFAVAEPDAIALREAKEFEFSGNDQGEDKISIVPIAVDADALEPVERQSKSLKILTLGTLHYPPNADGIRWFTSEVFPIVKKKIPGVHLTIVGKNPPKDIQEFAKDSPESVRVTGYVTDLDPYFEEAALIVVPVRAGGGMRVRILEAFARGMPMVTTTVGLEGIDAVPGVDVLVEDTPAQFAEAVIKLLQDEILQTTLAENGRRLVEKKYDYRVVLGALENVYHKSGNGHAETTGASLPATA